MANYSVANSTVPAGTAQVATAAVYWNLVSVAASSGNFNSANGAPQAIGLRRGKIYDILVGTNGTPADNFMEFRVAKATIGTTIAYLGGISSVSSAYSDDPADVGFSAAVTVNASVASTAIFSILADAWYVGVNQRASYRWVSAPGSELVYAAASSAAGNVNGLTLGVRSGGYTGTTTGTIFFAEQ